MNLEAKIYNFLKEVEDNKSLSMISFTVANKDEVLFDYKKEPYLKDGLQLVFSITKSFTSLAIGMLYDKGLINLDEKIIGYFKDELPVNYDPLISEITIRHILTMTSGIVKENNFEMLKTGDYRTYFLSQEVAYKPGTHYQYHSATSHMLSALFTKITGVTIEDYLKEHLFEPLNITNYHWSKAPEGINFGGYGLSLNNDALIKLGQLLLNHGNYKGKQLISKAYLDLATSPQAIKQDYVGNPNAKAIGYQYGFQFHVSPNLSYRADGAFGQIVVIFNDLAFISTAQFTDYEFLYAMIYKHFTSESIPAIETGQLEAFVSGLTFKEAPKENHFNLHKTYHVESNKLEIETLEFSHDYLLLHFKNGKTDKIEYNFDQSSYGMSHYAKDLKVVNQKHWVIPNYEDNELTLKILYIETPFFAEYKFKFEDEALTFSFKPSANFLFNGFTVTSK